MMDKPCVLPAEPGETIFPLGTVVITRAAGDELPKIAYTIEFHPDLLSIE
jgi:hypothetical protein